MAFAFFDPRKWKLVPIEPTDEMLSHVLAKRMEALIKGEKHTLIDIYRNMVKAAPTKGFFK